MKRKTSTLPGWVMALVAALFAGVFYVLVDALVPTFGAGRHVSLPDALRAIGALVVVIGAFAYVALVEDADVFDTRALLWLHRLVGGAVGGAACAALAGRQADLVVLAACAIAGAVLAAIGLAGRLGRGL